MPVRRSVSAVPPSDAIGPAYCGAIRVSNPFFSTPRMMSPPPARIAVSPPSNAATCAYLAIRVRVGSRLALRRDRVRRGWQPRVHEIEEGVVVQVDQSGKEQVARTGLDHARGADLDAVGRLR